MNKLEVLVKRLEKIGVKIELIGNTPWIYLNKVNDHRVKEKFQANHGFTIAWLTMKGDIEFSDIKEIFKTIRKYL